MPTESRLTESPTLEVKVSLPSDLSGKAALKLSIEISYAGELRAVPLRNVKELERAKWAPAFAVFCLRSVHSAGQRIWWEGDDGCFDRFHQLVEDGNPPSLNGEDALASEAWKVLWGTIAAARVPKSLRWLQPPMFSFFRGKVLLDDAGQASALAELERAYQSAGTVHSTLDPAFRALLDAPRAAVRLSGAESIPPTAVDRAPTRRISLPRSSALLILGGAVAFGAIGGHFLRAPDASVSASPVLSVRCGNANLTQWLRNDAYQYTRLFGDVQRDFRAYNAAFQIEDSSDHDEQHLERYSHEPPIKHQYLFTDCRFYCSSRAYWLKLSKKSRQKTGVSKLTKDNPQVKLLLPAVARPTDVTPPHYFLGTGAGKTPLMYVYPFVDEKGYPEFVLELYDDRQDFRMGAELDNDFREKWRAAGESVDWTTQDRCLGDPCEDLIPKTAR
jgi:hypothetical protein